MPKATQNTAAEVETNELNADTSIDNVAETAPVTLRSLTIQGVGVNVRVPFTAGQVLTDATASVLNQTFLENIRNNSASKIKAAKKAWIEEGAKGLAEGETNPNTEDNFVASPELLAEIQKYADEYEFGVRKLRDLEPADPVEKEARKIARELINAALRQQGVKVKDVSEDKYEEAVAAYAAQDSVLEEARRRVEITKSIGASSLNLADLVPAGEPAGEGGEADDGQDGGDGSDDGSADQPE